MRSMTGKMIAFCACVLVFLSCSKPSTETSFYFWRTSFDLSAKEKNALAALEVKHLYVRLFDVDLPKDQSQPQPVAIIDRLDTATIAAELIPVIFMTNRTFVDLSLPEVKGLAAKVHAKCRQLLPVFRELQIDCDWSDATRENYFLFLQELTLLAPAVELSCTLRLHQVKYAQRTGVPPVRKAMLMFYNMGNVANPNEPNSLFDPANAMKYVSYIKKYRLPLDVALPVFTWQVHYRHNRLQGLLNKKMSMNTADSSLFAKQEKSNFRVKKDSLLNGVYLAQNDVLRDETLTAAQLKECAAMLAENLEPQKRRVVFFDLDETNLNRYENTVLKEAAACFN